MTRYLAALEKRGIRAREVNGKLRLSPRSRLTPELINKVTANAELILAELRRSKQESLALSNVDTLEILSHDPRPDLADDSHLWDRFLQAARRTRLDLLSTLYTFRCQGCRLRRSVTGYHVCFESPDPCGGYQSKSEFVADFNREIYGRADGSSPTWTDRANAGIADLLAAIGDDCGGAA